MLARIVSLLALTASSLAVPAETITSLGYLKCSSDGQVTGYLSKSLNKFGEYIGVSPDSDSNDVNHRMLVNLDVTANGTQSILVKNAPDNDYPFLGGIGGEEGSTIGSDGDYLLVGGTESTASGVTSSYCGNTFTHSTNTLRKCASTIWIYNSTTNEVTPQWTNDDGTVVSANIGYVDAAFVLTGNKTEFEDTWSDSVQWITLTFET